MIELGRSYRTRDGREVRIYAVQCGGKYPVHGAILCGNNVWVSEQWQADGSDTDNDASLVEIRPRAIDRMIEWCRNYLPDSWQQDAVEAANKFKAEEDAQS